jgi:hypothetical protein
MERQIGACTTYGSHFQFIRNFLLERQNEEMNQNAKTYAKLQLSNRRFTKEKCV